MIRRALIVLMAGIIPAIAQARCLPQTDMTPAGECGKSWPAADTPRAPRSGFPEGRPQGHCWACMHGCTPENDAKFCGWTASGDLDIGAAAAKAMERCGPYGCVLGR